MERLEHAAHAMGAKMHAAYESLVHPSQQAAKPEKVNMQEKEINAYQLIAAGVFAIGMEGFGLTLPPPEK